MTNKRIFKNKLTLVILGRSGAGKGTQADFVLERLKRYGAKHLETGRFLRNLLKKSNFTTRIGKQVMKSGGLFPAWFAAFTWLKELIEYGHGDKHLVFDGAPRRIWEAELIDDVTKWHGRYLPVCIYVKVSEKEGMRRLLLRRRSDDQRIQIYNRMKFFKKYVMPVIRYYQRRGRLVEVNGEMEPGEVFKEIDRVLKRKLGQRWPSNLVRNTVN